MYKYVHLKQFYEPGRFQELSWSWSYFSSDMVLISLFSKIQLVVYYQCCVLIG